MSFDYFTYWNAVGTVAALPVLAGVRATGRTAPTLVVALVVVNIVVGVLGSWLVAYRMRIPREYHRRMLRNQLWMHDMPLVVAMALLALWPLAAGAPARPRHVARGLAVVAVAFSVYLSVPSKRHCLRGLEKTRQLYHVPESGLLLVIGTAVALAAAGLCAARDVQTLC